jgi:hypothetical protein
MDVFRLVFYMLMIGVNGAIIGMQLGMMIRDPDHNGIPHIVIGFFMMLLFFGLLLLRVDIMCVEAVVQALREVQDAAGGM